MGNVDEHSLFVERAHEPPSLLGQALVLVDGGRAAVAAAVVPRKRHEPHTCVIRFIERALPLGQQLRALDGEQRRRLAVFRRRPNLRATAAQRQPVLVRPELGFRCREQPRKALVLRRVEQTVPPAFLRLRRIRPAEQRKKLYVMLVFQRRLPVDVQVVLAQMLSGLAAFVQRIAVKIKQFHSHPPNAFSICRMRGRPAPSSP